MKDWPWFGDPWPSAEDRAPICEDEDRMPTPVGQPCVLCEETVRDGDRGTLVSSVKRAPDGQGFVMTPEAEHVECHLRNALGGAGHLTTPKHRPGGCDGDGGLSYRQSALLVWAWVQRMGVENVIEAHRYPRVIEEMRQELTERAEALAGRDAS